MPIKMYVARYKYMAGKYVGENCTVADRGKYKRFTSRIDAMDYARKCGVPVRYITVEEAY